MIERASGRRVAAVLTLLALGSRPALAEERVVSPAEARIKTDVTFLAHDDRDGRGIGTPGIEAAAAHIASIFKEAGLTTAQGADGYFQPFPILGDPKLVKTPELSLHGPDGKTIEAGKDDFNPLAIGGTGGKFRRCSHCLRRLRDHRQRRIPRARLRRLHRQPTSRARPFLLIPP